MENSNARFKVTVLASGNYVIQQTHPSKQDFAYSDRGVWASLSNPGLGHGPTFFDPDKPEDIKNLKVALETLIRRDHESQEMVKRTTPLASISAEEFLRGKTTIPKPRMYTESQLKTAFRYYAFTSISQQPYNEEELDRAFENFCRVLNK